MKTQNLSEHITESFNEVTQINESVITDFVSNLSKDEMQLVLGMAGAVGLFGGTYVLSKLIKKLKSSGGTGKKIADKIEKMASAAGRSTQTHK